MATPSRRVAVLKSAIFRHGGKCQNSLDAPSCARSGLRFRFPDWLQDLQHMSRINCRYWKIGNCLCVMGETSFPLCRMLRVCPIILVSVQVRTCDF